MEHSLESRVRIERIDGWGAAASHPLRRRVRALVGPSYVDPGPLLEREMDHCDTIYVAQDDDGELLAFYLVAWETVAWGRGGGRTCVYLGLSASRDDAKGRGFARRLYKRCLLDARRWEERHRREVLLWGTTATPLVYGLAARFLRDMEPRPDGGFSEAGAAAAHRLRAHANWPPPRGTEHPFVLRGVARDTAYSARERGRLTHASRRCGLLDRLGVQEARGDRLLFIACVPERID